MSKEPPAPLRGEAAWKAAKQLVSEKNEAAYARARRERAAHDARVRDELRAAARREAANLPTQPRGR